MIKLFGFNSEVKVFEAFGRRIDDGFFIISTALGAVILAIACSYLANFNCGEIYNNNEGLTRLRLLLLFNPYIYVLMGAAIFLFGHYGIYKDHKQLQSDNEDLKEKSANIDQLKKRLESVQEDCKTRGDDISRIHENLIETWLKGIFRQVSLSTYSRISVYYEDNEEFTILARYSSNPKFSKIHKQKFGLDQGVISHAWQHGEHSELECPKYDEAHAEAYNAYIKKAYGYTDNELSEMTMKSCRYFGLSITDADDNIGVILFESESETELTPKINEEIRNYCEKYQSHLCQFVKDGMIYDRTLRSNIKVKNNSTDQEVLQLLGDKK